MECIHPAMQDANNKNSANLDLVEDDVLRVFVTEHVRDGKLGGTTKARGFRQRGKATTQAEKILVSSSLAEYSA